MDLPDCPPGAEGYEDSVVEVPKKPSLDDTTCTKAEQEFQDHLNSLKIKAENGELRCMVERRGRDISGKWIYLCYPCAAVCSGETILQTHISGKKHKAKLSMKNVWPLKIFTEHPYILTEKGIVKEKAEATEKVLQKMAEEVKYHNEESELDLKYNKYRGVRCHIQDSIDEVKTPLIGLEYLVEHPPEEVHYEPSYVCTLCTKHGHPRTIINHLTCYWHRYHYLTRHFPKAGAMLAPYRGQGQYREGVGIIINRLVQRIEDKYGRLQPVNIDKEEYDKERERIHQWIFKGRHFDEKDGLTFEEVVDVDLIESLNKSSNDSDKNKINERLAEKKDPSPPVVAAPSKPIFNSHTRPRHERQMSVDVLSDISDEPDTQFRGKIGESNRFEPYSRDTRAESPRRVRYSKKNKTAAEWNLEKVKPPNYEYKQKLVSDQRKAAEEAARKTLAYHEKNPEKHPLYPEEWKKFWNRRYKEIQAEGKDPSKHDFKPEWITYWTARMKQLHEEELRTIVSELYRKMCLPLPDLDEKPAPARKSPERSNRSSETRRRSPDPRDRRRSPDPRRRSPDPRRRSPDPRRRSPDPRRRSPDARRRSPHPRRPSPDMRRRSPIDHRRSPPDHRRTPTDHRRPPIDHRRRSPDPRRRTPDRRRSPERWRAYNDRYHRDYRVPPSKELHSPPRHRPRSRSRSPLPRARSPIRTHIQVESIRRSHSPLSRRDTTAPLRNRSPVRAAPAVAPSMQTVLISDEELKPDDGGLSPWDSDNEDSFSSVPEKPTSRAGSEMSRQSRNARREYSRPAEPSDLGPAENVVATLRLLVALEDYLGSLGPKVVDLLTEALKMEKEKGNSSEELLERESAVVLIETAKEKLKGAVQAGLVPPAAAPAVRSAVVRAAATLHEADTRARNKAKSESMPAPAPAAPARKRKRMRPHRGRRGAQQKNAKEKPDPVPVAGVGEVDRAQIAQQMAAALIAQGKTDVSSEELAQLVEAVVGMAEAKKREAESKKKTEMIVEQPKPKPPLASAVSGTASALQMLQSAYDENDKKVEKDEKDYTPDAMDGLSDSDLETLLKNFNELSAEEQHSLIAYLKKLEAREPQRVERLRQYVSAAAHPAPAAPAAPARPDTKPVTIDSDDDDYTVEEVFQSATQKVKEDQIRQEMEIVKKSLEETTKEPTPTPENPKPAPSIDLSQHMSSATDLLALVQASIQSTAANPPPSSAAPADVVVSHTQPRSFGDLPEPPMGPSEPSRPMHPTAPPAQNYNQSNQQNFNDNNQNWDSRPVSNMGNERPPLIPGGPFGLDRAPYNQESYNRDNRSPFNQDNRAPFNQDGRNFAQDNRGPFGQDNRGGFNQNNRSPFNQGSRGNFNQDNQNNRGDFNQDIQGSFNQDNRGPFHQDNQASGNQGSFNQNRGNYNQDSRGPLLPDSRGPLLPSSRPPLLKDNRAPLLQDNRAPLLQDNRAPLLQDNRGQGMQSNMGFPMQNNWGADNRGGFNQDNRTGPRGGFDNQFNQGGGNFTNGMQGNNMKQQYGNYDQQKNFRGRGGRGQYGGGMRGRGRPGYY